MQVNIDRDQLVSVWRLIEKQLLTTQDHVNIEHAAIEIHDALVEPETSTHKRGRPTGSRNKAKGRDNFVNLNSAMAKAAGEIMNDPNTWSEDGGVA